MVWVCIGIFQQIPWFSNNSSNISNLQIQQFQNDPCQIGYILYDFIMPSMSGQKSMQYYDFRIQQQWTRSVELKQLGVTCIIMHCSWPTYMMDQCMDSPGLSRLLLFSDSQSQLGYQMILKIVKIWNWGVENHPNYIVSYDLNNFPHIT
jgi:hypothetical protein